MAASATGPPRSAGNVTQAEVGLTPRAAFDDSAVPDREIEVHPFAATFPMLPDDELDALAADIKANGLIHPIVKDQTGRLIDGRNRLEACRRAGVTPTETVLPDGADPITYILRENVARRHLTKSQRAMMAAQATLLGTSNQANVAQAAGISQQLVSQAKSVLDKAEDLTTNVLTGVMTTQDALDTIAERKRTAEENAAIKAAIAAEFPDLIEEVEAGRRTLESAVRAVPKRRARVAGEAQAAADEAAHAEGRPTPAEQAEQERKARVAEDNIRGHNEALTAAITYLATPSKVTPEEKAAYLDGIVHLAATGISADLMVRAGKVLAAWIKLRRQQEKEARS